jgi:hypothetical protein
MYWRHGRRRVKDDRSRGMVDSKPLEIDIALSLA